MQTSEGLNPVADLVLVLDCEFSYINNYLCVLVYTPPTHTHTKGGRRVGVIGISHEIKKAIKHKSLSFVCVWVWMSMCVYVYVRVSVFMCDSVYVRMSCGCWCACECVLLPVCVCIYVCTGHFTSVWAPFCFMSEIHCILWHIQVSATALCQSPVRLFRTENQWDHWLLIITYFENNHLKATTLNLSKTFGFTFLELKFDGELL